MPANAPEPPRLPRAPLLLLFAGAFLLFGLTAHGYVENTDAEITMHAARAWWLRGDPGLLVPGGPQPGADRAPSWPAEAAIVGEITHPELPRYGRIGRTGLAYVWFPIGHQALLVPAVALGGALAEAFPEVEERFRARQRDPVFGQLFFERFVVSFVSPIFAAGAAVALVVLLLALGVGPAAALGASAVAVFATQFWPGTRETMSDMAGSFFLLATAASIARYRAGAEASALLVAGLLGGAGVLVRYPQALPLAVLGAWALFVALRRRRPLDAAWFVIGGLPPAALLVYANLWRFGDPLETGYSAALGVGSYPVHWGLTMILASSGKGILWFALPLWLAFAQLGKAEVRRSAALWFALAVLLVPLPFYASLHYWAAGQCWGIRYLTGSIVLFVAVALAVGRPWRSAPAIFAIVVLFGLIGSAGGIVTSYRALWPFAATAAEQHWDRPGGAETLTDNINWGPRFSPLHAAWNYARLSAAGRIDSGRSADTTEPLYGITVPDERVPKPRREDVGFRHVWWRYVADYWPGFEAALVVPLIAIAALASLALGAWLLVRTRRSSGEPAAGAH